MPCLLEIMASTMQCYWKVQNGNKLYWCSKQQPFYFIATGIKQFQSLLFPRQHECLCISSRKHIHSIPHHICKCLSFMDRAKSYRECFVIVPMNAWYFIQLRWMAHNNAKDYSLEIVLKSLMICSFFEGRIHRSLKHA